MIKTRVLVVDDSVMIRRVLSEELDSDPEIEVIGVAANGKIALAKIKQLTPDLVILDVEMPELDGLQTLAEIRKDYPKLPVIMFSATTEQGAASTLEALSLGATDYFTKPTGLGGLDASRRVIREELAPAIKALCKRNTGIKETKPTIPLIAPTPFSSSGRKNKVNVVVIGVSTGGPNALAELFQTIPGDLAVPILIVQHMPPMFTRLLAERLTKTSKWKVSEASNDDQLHPGEALIAPGDFHMVVTSERGPFRVLLNQEPQENSCRPAADPLFRSAARVYGNGVLAVVLTGMGQDGLRGCEAIRSSGGQVIVQDEASSVVWGMPGFVARAGLADKILPLNLIGTEITNRVRQK
jgi:two-component system, chemotaxis family, protein-glutamate methylesterase/glutaminase